MLPKPTTFSQAYQDRYVSHVLIHFIKDYQPDAPKFFLDVGANHPIQLNNTLLLENHHGFSGISVEMSPKFASDWSKIRRTPLVITDGLQIQYDKLLHESKIPPVLDYLSLDIDEFQVPLVDMFPWDKVSFKVATIEHDDYRFTGAKKKIRQKLHSLGYILANQIFWEDWWINESYIDFPSELISTGVEEPEAIINKVTKFTNQQLKSGTLKVFNSKIKCGLNENSPHLEARKDANI